MPLPHASDISRDDFLALYGGIYEHSPWVAEGVFDGGLAPEDADPDQLATRMAKIVAAADHDQQLDLIRARR